MWFLFFWFQIFTCDQVFSATTANLSSISQRFDQYLDSFVSLRVHERSLLRKEILDDCYKTHPSSNDLFYCAIVLAQSPRTLLFSDISQAHRWFNEGIKVSSSHDKLFGEGLFFLSMLPHEGQDLKRATVSLFILNRLEPSARTRFWLAKAYLENKIDSIPSLVQSELETAVAVEPRFGWTPSFSVLQDAKLSLALRYMDEAILDKPSSLTGFITFTEQKRFSLGISYANSSISSSGTYHRRMHEAEGEAVSLLEGLKVSAIPFLHVGVRVDYLQQLVKQFRWTPALWVTLGHGFRRFTFREKVFNLQVAPSLNQGVNVEWLTGLTLPVYRDLALQFRSIGRIDTELSFLSHEYAGLENLFESGLDTRWVQTEIQGQALVRYFVFQPLSLSLWFGLAAPSANEWLTAFGVNGEIQFSAYSQLPWAQLSLQSFSTGKLGLFVKAGLDI